MAIGTYYLPKETILRLMYSMVDENISEESLLQPSNGLSREITRFISDYSKVKPSNLAHSDIRVVS